MIESGSRNAWKSEQDLFDADKRTCPKANGKLVAANVGKSTTGTASRKGQEAGIAKVAALSVAS
jgi:hypothetical protein